MLKISANDGNLNCKNTALLEKVDEFCYVGDMLEVVRRYDSAVTTKAKYAWKKVLGHSIN